MFPRAPGQDVSGMRIESGDGLEKILADELALDEDFNAPWKRFQRWVAHHSILVAAGIAALAALAMMLLGFFAREHRVVGPQAPARAPRRRRSGARLRPRARGRRLSQHGARDPARPRRPRLLLDLGGDDREGEARPRDPDQRQAPGEREPRALRDRGARVLRRAGRQEGARAEQDGRRDPAALGAVARALGADDREARRGREGRDQLGPQPELVAPAGGPRGDRRVRLRGRLLARRRGLVALDREP